MIGFLSGAGGDVDRGGLHPCWVSLPAVSLASFVPGTLAVSPFVRRHLLRYLGALSSSREFAATVILLFAGRAPGDVGVPSAVVVSSVGSKVGPYCSLGRVKSTSLWPAFSSRSQEWSLTRTPSLVLD